jgi:hypothetical protein
LPFENRGQLLKILYKLGSYRGGIVKEAGDGALMLLKGNATQLAEMLSRLRSDDLNIMFKARGTEVMQPPGRTFECLANVLSRL